MDQGPRSVFLAQAVLPEERTKVMGIVNTVKTVSQSIAPTMTGAMAENGHFGAVFVLAGTLKVSYDIALMGLWWFGRRREQRKTDGLDLEDLGPYFGESGSEDE